MVSTIVLAIVVAVVFTQIANIATTVYLHRALAHRAVALSPPLTLVFRFVIWLLTGIRPRQWAAVHRKHHAFTDEADDPHSPKQLGWRRVQLTNVMLYRAVARDPKQVARHARDLPQTRLDRWLLDHAMVGLAITTGGLVVALGWWAGVLAAAMHFVGYLLLSGAVNAIAHTFGERPYQNSATNLQWLAFLTCGEGLHNNHHAAPTSARFSLGRGQVDPGWWMIRLFERVGLAQVRHRQPVFVSTEVAA